jgi:hypothetical protein
MDGDRPILTSRTAALLGALATALRRREVNMGVVALIDSGAFQDFAFRADITTTFGSILDSRMLQRCPRC